MNHRLLAMFAGVIPLLPMVATAQTTAFTYQGRLTDNAMAASGHYDFRFSLHTAAAGGSQIGSPVILTPVTVADGLFSVALDFGSQFTGAERYLQVEVRPAGSAAPHTVLAPRQRVTSAPYASRAATAGTASTSAALSGNVTASQIVGGTFSTALFPSVIPRLDTANAFAQPITLGVTQQMPLGLSSSSTGGTWLNLGNSSSAAASTWNLISTGSANGEGAGKLLLRDSDNNAVRMTISTDGSIGIGTTAPTGALLDVEGDIRLNDRNLLLRPGTDPNHGLGWYGLGKLWGALNVDGPVLFGWGGGVLGTAGGAVAMNWDSAGTVRVGSPARSGTLVATTSGDKSLRFTNDDFVPVIEAVSTTVGDAYAGFMRIRHAVELWPKSDGTAGARLDVRNAAGAPTIALDGATGEGTMRALNLTGGSDVAEPIPMPEDVPAGAAVVIDADRPGEVKMSAKAYDTCVAGIVSGANGVKPGLSLRQEGVLDGGKNVALTGRVYALADASDGPVVPGDLLVTSSRPGHVMKAVDRERSQGAIIGKAMTGLGTGTGHVLVLVNLQ